MARRKNRGQPAALSNEGKTWQVAFYIRLSREDARGFDESESVQNQRMILRDWLTNQQDEDQYTLADEFVDDGVSGTTDEERPAFLRMLRAIEAGRVNCVVVKNLARSFRNHADQGYYLEEWFVLHRVRFVSLYQQPVDTYKDPRGAMSIGVPVQGVLNESHAKDTSENVRRVLDKKREKGMHIGSFAAYGYQKDPKDKNALIIDPEAAAVVRDIYAWFLDGMSKSAIVHTLNHRGVLCPSRYKESKGMRYKNPNAGKNPLWNAKTVGEILKNRLYAGDMVQGRYRVRSYKIHIQDIVPPEEWFVVENTHQPIIPREEFNQVQELLGRDTRTAPGQKSLYLFSGFLRCADCGKALCRSQVKGRVYYFCRTYKEQSRQACTKHSIRHAPLEQAVLHLLQQQAYLADAHASIIQRVRQAPARGSPAQDLENLIAAQNKELSSIARYTKDLYQDWKNAYLTQEDYQRLYEDYQQQTQRIHNVMLHLEEERKQLAQQSKDDSPLWAAYRERETIDHLTRDILIALVDHIQVLEGGSICIKLKSRAPLSYSSSYIPSGNTPLA